MNVIDEMAKALEVLIKLSPNRHGRLTLYMRAFEERYQTDRVVPILELLDESFGLGSPYGPKYQYDGWRSPARDQLLLRKLHDCWRSGAKIVELTSNDITGLAVAVDTSAQYPISADLFVQILATSQEAINQNDYQMLISPRLGETGAGKTVGRFAWLLGKQAIDSICAVNSAESQLVDKHVMAEITCWPDALRMMNVAFTPSTGLPSIAIRCVESDGRHQIPLSEIVIGMDAGRFFAEWARTGQQRLAKFWSQEFRRLTDRSPLNLIAR
jgi:lantibiotic biosynthesis protein